jgi:UDP-N-acetylglucosamine 2-epimerase (non-hydrolysing)
MFRPFRLLLVVGARPNFMKMAPIIHELKRDPDTFAWRLVHTGQHYDAAMSEIFFEQLGMPKPDVDLGVGSGSHAQQTAAVMAAFEAQVLEWQPDIVVVVGDVNSTLACALVASKLHVAVAHVEAGLRSFDRSMPEEINRMLTDQVSDLLFTTEASAEDNLRREGVDASKIHFTGNVMIDTLLAHSAEARRRGVAGKLNLTPGQYGVLTLHRPSNVDDPDAFERLFDAIGRIAADLPIVFPVHPRTRPAIERSAGVAPLIAHGRLKLFDPLGYLDFLGLMADSAVVLTDSGGIQEETTVLGVPCLTMRETTERPVTITDGTNLLVGTDPGRILEGWARVKRGTGREAQVPPLWDGRAAQRIVQVVRSYAEAAAGSPAADPRGPVAAGT